MERCVHKGKIARILAYGLLGAVLGGTWVVPSAALGQRTYVKMEKRPVHQRRLTKIRPGSYIRREEESIVRPDLRGAWQRARDEQLALHTKRMAQLDVIAEIAAREDDGRLLARVDVVRRRERERFRLAMDKIREESRKQVWDQKK